MNAGQHTGREWAREYFGCYRHYRDRETWLRDECPTCGLLYVKDSPEDQRLHKGRHRLICSIFDPQPNAALAARFAQDGALIRVEPGKERYLRERLEKIGLGFNKEGAYDFLPYRASSIERGGFILTDVEGRALGGGGIGRTGYTNLPPGPVLTWVWIAPPWRRQGLFTSLWRQLEKLHPRIYPEPPFSDAMFEWLRTRRPKLPSVMLKVLSKAKEWTNG